MNNQSVNLAELIPSDLPSSQELIADGAAHGKAVEMGRSLYCEEKGVRSEREWRAITREKGISSTCMNIGMATWGETRSAIENIYEDALGRGVRPPDRFNLIAERRMGLPKNKRAYAAQETGPRLWSEQDWWETTHTVPIHAEAGDNIIGGPGSLDNVLDALRAGITSIGLLSQYTWRWPYFDDGTTQIAAVVRAGAALAARKDDGVVFNSYLDDGYPAMFHDYASYVGYAMLERYIAEELIGAAYSSSWGGLTQNPIVKAAVTLALDAVNPSRVPFSYLHGDTIGNTVDVDSNMAVLVNDLIFMKMVDQRYRLGTAIISVPLTEVERIPSWQEIAQVQTINRKCDDYVPMLEPYINWGKIEALRDALVDGGQAFFASALETMSQMDVDVTDPARVLVVIKRLGPEMCEQLFGAGERDDSYPRGRRPVLQTDLVRQTLEKRAAVLDALAAREPDEKLKGRKILVASTDVHEFAKFLLTSTFAAVGSRVIDCGINRDPEDIVKVAIETEADAIVVTTHNGVARSFGTHLLNEMRGAQIDPPVFMGGVLNEDIEGSDIPVDVRGDLHRLGIETPESIDQMLEAISGRVGSATP